MKHRLQVDLDHTDMQRLDTLAEVAELTKSEAVRRGVALLAALLPELQKGQRLVLEGPDGQRTPVLLVWP